MAGLRVAGPRLDRRWVAVAAGARATGRAVAAGDVPTGRRAARRAGRTRATPAVVLPVALRVVLRVALPAGESAARPSHRVAPAVRRGRAAGWLRRPWPWCGRAYRCPILDRRNAIGVGPSRLVGCGAPSGEQAPIVQRPRTPAFHAGNTGSNPVGGTRLVATTVRSGSTWCAEPSAGYDQRSHRLRGPVVQPGVHAGLSSRRSRVQIPSGPPFECPELSRLRTGTEVRSVGRPTDRASTPVG